jgi:hypothetical protein
MLWRGEQRRRGESPSTLAIIMNYLCCILFFIFLLLHLNYDADDEVDPTTLPMNWLIVFLPLLPLHLGLLYLYYQDLLKMRSSPSSTSVNSIKIYCYFGDTLSYLLTTILLYLHVSGNHPYSITFSIALTPLFFIALITLSIRFHSLCSSRERTQGSRWRHLLSLCILFFNLLLRVALPLLLTIRLEFGQKDSSRKLSWWNIFCPVWIVIAMCLTCSLRLLYHAIITNRNALTMRHHAAGLMVLFAFQLFIGSIATLVGCVRYDPMGSSVLGPSLNLTPVGSSKDFKGNLSRTQVCFFQSLSPWSG